MSFLKLQRGAKESYDYNSFLLAELKELQLHDDIQTQLEEERNLLQHADDIKQTIQHILQISSWKTMV